MLSQTVLADLRAMVHELRPLSSTSLGLPGGAARAGREHHQPHRHAGGSAGGAGVDGLPAEMAEDVHRIVAEALHNVVKHAEAAGSPSRSRCAPAAR